MKRSNATINELAQSTSSSSIRRNVRRRRSILTYPTKPLGNEEKETFKVTKEDKPNCNLIKAGLGVSLGETTYSVKKIEREDGEIYTNFYVVIGPDFKRTEKKYDEFATHLDRIQFYEGQLAFAQCQPGWVNYVWVNDGKPIDARRCGIASLLTGLCLMDPTINKLTDDSQAVKYIKEHEKVMNDVEVHCKNAFVGLHMVANPKDAAYAYLSAAMQENYNLMIIQERKSKLGFTLSSKFFYYNTRDASKKYDAKTGRVGACECDAFGGLKQNQDCKGYDGYWYFCK